MFWTDEIGKGQALLSSHYMNLLGEAKERPDFVLGDAVICLGRGDKILGDRVALWEQGFQPSQPRCQDRW